MTRINIGIPPKKLTQKHLLAEHREIKRIPNVIKSGRFSLDGQPKEFTLGKGHVKFFYDKLLYLKNRYIDIHTECISRGYNVSNYISAWDDVPESLFNNYYPTRRDIKIITKRINDRLKSSKYKVINNF